MIRLADLIRQTEPGGTLRKNHNALTFQREQWRLARYINRAILEFYSLHQQVPLVIQKGDQG